MAAFYVDEEEVWKCPKHPSKRHRPGICPTCLRERLSSLCPDCATVRPCACAVSSSSSTTSSSSFSRVSISGGDNLSAETGTVGRVSNLIKSEPAFRRSRSVAVPFMRSRSKPKTKFVGSEEINRTKTTAFWGWLKGGNKSNTGGGGGGGDGDVGVEEERRMMMKKSRSVAVTTSDYGKSKGGAKWYFPSPIKAFRQSKLSKAVLHERSPLYRGAPTKQMI